MIENINIPNLDGIEDDRELVQLHHAFHLLTVYLVHKLEARKLRLRGRTDDALKCERLCEDHYRCLPPWARW